MINNLELETKQSKNPLVASIYGLVAEEVNLIRDTINELIDALNGLDPDDSTGILAHKVGVSEAQAFSDEEKVQGRENIGAAYRKVYSVEITSSSVDSMVVSGFYEGKFTAGDSINNQSWLWLHVFAKSLNICIQVQYGVDAKIWLRQGDYIESAWVWSEWTLIADDLINKYLSVEVQEFDTNQINQLLSNLNILTDVSGYTFGGFVSPNGDNNSLVAIAEKNIFYLAITPGIYGQYGLTIYDPGIYIIKNSNFSGGWNIETAISSMISLLVAQARTEITNSQLIPGQLYKLTNHPNDRGIILQAATTNSFFDTGVRIGRVPLTYKSGPVIIEVNHNFYATTSHGVWVRNSAVVQGDFVIWGGRFWEAVGNTNTLAAINDWTLNPTEWTLVNMFSGWYSDKIFGCTFDINQGTYGYISKQWDTKGNEFGETTPPSDGFLVEYNDWNLAYDNILFENNKLLRCYNIKAWGAFELPSFIKQNSGNGILGNLNLHSASVSYNTFVGPVSINPICGLMESTLGIGALFEHNEVAGYFATITIDNVVEYNKFNGFFSSIQQMWAYRSVFQFGLEWSTIDFDGFWIGDSIVYYRTDLSSQTLTENLIIRDDLVLDNPMWDDIIIYASNLRAGASPPTFALFYDSIYGTKFDDGATQILYGAFEMPHTYKEGTDLYPHLHWTPSTTNTGTCVFTLAYTICGVNEIFDHEAYKTFTQTGGGILQKHQLVSSNTPISGSGLKIGDICVFSLTRNGSTDSLVGDAFLHSFGIHYQVDTMGSRQIATK